MYCQDVQRNKLRVHYFLLRIKNFKMVNGIYTVDEIIQIT